MGSLGLLEMFMGSMNLLVFMRSLDMTLILTSALSLGRLVPVLALALGSILDYASIQSRPLACHFPDNSPGYNPWLHC